MKTYLFVKRFLIVFLAWAFPCAISAAPQWYPIGLSDRAVHCLLADDTSTIFAGTESGISYRVSGNGQWYHFKMLPVTAIVRIANSGVAVAAGNGSDSDGVYFGLAIAGINKNNVDRQYPTYNFMLKERILQPTALAVAPAVSEEAVLPENPPMVLYVGNKNSVAWGLIDMSVSLSKLAKIKSYPFSFGVEDPFCSSLCVMRNRLYAGGYDRFLGNPATSFLCYCWGDSLIRRLPRKTTAMTTGLFSKLFGLNSPLLAVADRDSGVFLYGPNLDGAWRHLQKPLGNPVVSLYAGKKIGTGGDTVLYAATRDGVFRATEAEPQPIWVKLGTLPVEPIFITGMGSTGDLLAATSKGVYRYGETGTGVKNSRGLAAGKAVHGKKRVSMAIMGKAEAVKPGFDLRGRSAAHASARGLLIHNSSAKSSQ